MDAASGPYAVLGVGSDATEDQIRRAFRRIARSCHPDVAGDDPEKSARFRTARDAYEVLSDPDRRAAHDRTRAPPPRSPHVGAADREARFEAFFRRASAGSAEDLFRDFGVGDDVAPRSRVRTPSAEARRGGDVDLDLDVPASIAREGGTIVARYARLRRVAVWRPEDPDPGLEPVDETQRLDVPAGTRHLSSRRYVGLGDAGAHGGPHGQLVVRFRVVEDPVDDVVRVDVPVVVALLGGEVGVDTAAGRVRLRIPPGTSSATRLRLQGRGRAGHDGTRGDQLVEVRIVVPSRLDPAAEALVRQLAEHLER